jgi:[ribosomal protein S18]-alanine N-acetyltransferase
VNQPFALTIRPAALQDAQTMAQMSRELIEAGLNWRYTPARIAALMRERESMAVVACDGQRVAGFAIMHFGDEHAHLALLAVRADQQRRGVGRRLHGWLLQSASVAGMVSIGVELRADNAVAHQFYLGLGFCEAGLVPHYYDGHIAARQMRLRLKTRDASL